jgi:hypothetical protein
MRDGSDPSESDADLERMRMALKEIAEEMWHG